MILIILDDYGSKKKVHITLVLKKIKGKERKRKKNTKFEKSFLLESAKNNVDRETFLQSTQYLLKKYKVCRKFESIRLTDAVRVPSDKRAKLQNVTL